MQQKKKEFLRKFPLKEWEELDQASGSSDNLYKNIPKVWLHDLRVGCNLPRLAQFNSKVSTW